MYSNLLFISGGEIFVIFLAVLLLFGANKIPEIARGLGKGFREFQKATDEIKREMNSYTEDIKKESVDIKKEIENTNNDLNG